MVHYIGYYRFGSNSDTPVRCVYLSCNEVDMCNFMSPETDDELQVSTPNNTLRSSDNCMVNYVEIIHDCMPRLIDLTLVFTSHSKDDKLYLQVSLKLDYIREFECLYKYKWGSKTNVS